jgi:hypothetical protein
LDRRVTRIRVAAGRIVETARSSRWPEFVSEGTASLQRIERREIHHATDSETTSGAPLACVHG